MFKIKKSGLIFLIVAAMIFIFAACGEQLNETNADGVADAEIHVESEGSEESEDPEESEAPDASQQPEESEAPESPEESPELLRRLALETPQEPGDGLHWVGAWSTAMYFGDVDHSWNQGIRDAGIVARDRLPDSTLRQLIRPAIGGDTVRLTFSNEYGETPLTINSVSIAIASGRPGTDIIDTATNTAITFDGNAGAVIPAGEFITSDSVAFPIDALERVAVSIYFGEMPDLVTSHIAARANSFTEPGDLTLAETLDGRTNTNWFVLCNLDVLAPEHYRSIVVIGDSITDGFGISGEQYLRWVDILMNNLQEHESTQHLSVINMGIGGNGLVGNQNDNPSPVLYLFERDVLNQPGVGYVVIQIGVNNLAFGAIATAGPMINAYTELIEAAHAHDINVFLATITPYTPESGRREREQIRNTINDWMFDQYADGAVYGLLDFDMLLRDPGNPSRILPEYDRDGIHPNNAGYARMGELLFNALYSR
ncbi:MAG: GDSL-type esterase/lipase family protein [Defluviitaleaceae bacterium]|nr:GDSL-type esterase/lipase family protein [Defluviitaleaceae bacterium]